jgi:hypothetical protein
MNNAFRMEAGDAFQAIQVPQRQPAHWAADPVTKLRASRLGVVLVGVPGFKVVVQGAEGVVVILDEEGLAAETGGQVVSKRASRSVGRLAEAEQPEEPQHASGDDWPGQAAQPEQSEEPQHGSGDDWLGQAAQPEQSEEPQQQPLHACGDEDEDEDELLVKLLLGV